jgi:hypothetical protein
VAPGPVAPIYTFDSGSLALTIDSAPRAELLHRPVHWAD